MPKARPLHLLSLGVRMARFQIERRLPHQPEPVTGMRFDRDVSVPMRDGVHLMANVFRPIEDGRYPVVVSISPYGKDALPTGDYDLFRTLGMDVGTPSKSDYAAFEKVDRVELGR